MYQVNRDGTPNEGSVHMYKSMQDGTLLSGGIAAAANVGGAWINANAQKSINEDQIQHNMQMYNLSRDDAIALWERENAYNHPTQQMQRLKEAGLNPHLVYGNGADAKGGNISAPKATPAQLNAPQWGDALSSMGSYISLQAAQAGIEKTKAETDRIKQDTVGKQFDNEVNQKVGTDRLADTLNKKMIAASEQAKQQVLEVDGWITAMIGDQAYPLETATTESYGPFGQVARDKDNLQHKYLTEKYSENAIINAARKAGIENTIQELKNLKSRATLYNDQHQLNQVQLKIQDFSAELRKYGVSPETIQGLGILVSILRIFK